MTPCPAVESLLLGFRFAQNYFKGLAADVPAEKADFQPFAGSNTPLWIAGHLAVAHEFTFLTLGRPSPINPSWRTIFGTKIAPGSFGPGTPSLAECVADSKSSVNALCIAVAETPLEKFAEPRDGFLSQAFPTVGGLIVHLLTTHFATHLGQFSAWRRACGMPPVTIG